MKSVCGQHNIVLLTPPSWLLQLFNIVVDTEDTGKQLLQNGRLKRRYTIIPLNKISARTINTDVVKKAQSLVSNPGTYSYMSAMFCSLSPSGEAHGSSFSLV